MMMHDDLMLLRWGAYPRYACRLTHTNVDYFSLEYIGEGGMELYRDAQYQLLEGEWFWMIYPGPRFHYRPSPNVGWWSNRYLVITGSLAHRWREEGLLPIEPQPAPPGGDWGERLDRIMALADRTDTLGRRRAMNLLEGLLLELAESRRATEATPSWIAYVCAALQSLDEEKPDYARLATACGMSLRTLHRQFTAHMGVSLHAYAIQARLACARELLDTTDLPVKAVAERAGYANAYYFSRQFREQVGMPPARYRQLRRMPVD